MILEHASLNVHAGSEQAFESAFAQARKVVAQARGFRGLSLFRGVEEPSTYRLLIEWDSVDDHMLGFRESELYERWSELLRPHFSQPPQVHHGVPVDAKPTHEEGDSDATGDSGD